jgi:Nickel/cobalt transporter regulator/Glycine zipper 2TM domain
MKILGLASVMAVLLAVPGVAVAQNDSVGMPRVMPATGPGVGMPHVMPAGGVPAPRPAMPSVMPGHPGGHWGGGMRAPGGWSAYRPAVRGFMLPSYWISPSFYIGNYSRYGFSAPQSGYGWSRYYDDAVLTDGDGRVYDSVRGVDWDRYGYEDGGYNEDYSDSYGYHDDAPRAVPARRHKGVAGIIGAVIGGAVGAIAGDAIAGPGDRVAGAFIGGGVGAVAGSVLGAATERRGQRYLGDRNGRDYRDYDDRRNMPYDYDYRGNHAPDVTYDGHRPHWHRYGGRWGGSRVIYSGGGGYCCGGETIVTITQGQPVTTTTTTTTEEVIYQRAPARRRVAVRHWKPRPHYRPQPRCVCGS